MFRTLLIASTLAVQSVASMAQDYPNRPIKLIVPYAAGGAADTIARPIAEKLRDELGQPVHVENRAGAQSTLGSEVVARAEPDGYTLLINFSALMATQFFTKNVPYDASKDFTPIVKAAISPQCLVVGADLPIKTAKELVDYAKTQPKGLSYGSTGIGNPPHVAAELMKTLTGAEFVQVIYRGGPPIITDLLSGQIPMAFPALSTALPHAANGKLRIIGVLEKQRSAIAPDIPTVAENGLPGFSITDTWIGFLGPANLPKPIVAKLNTAINNVLKAPELRLLLQKAGYDVLGGTAEELEQQMKLDVETFRKVVEIAKITPQ